LKDAKVVSADQYFIDSTGKYTFDKSKLGEAHADCMADFIFHCEEAQLIETYPQIVVDNTSTQLHEISPYMLVAAAHDLPCKIITLMRSPQEVGLRNVHGVPESTLKNQWRNMQYAKIPGYWPHEILK
jgi:hypothetical protein